MSATELLAALAARDLRRLQTGPGSAFTVYAQWPVEAFEMTATIATTKVGASSMDGTTGRATSQGAGTSPP